jgi:hypothetical protein
MKNFKIIFALCAFLHSGFTFPVRPITAGATISAVNMVSGINIGYSYQKRTAAIRDGDPLWEKELKQERKFYTGGAVLLGVGVSAAISVAIFKRLPVLWIHYY